MKRKIKNILTRLSKIDLDIIAKEFGIKDVKNKNKQILIEELIKSEYIDNLKKKFNITWWELYHNHIYGIASVLLAIIGINWCSSNEDTKNTDLEKLNNKVDSIYYTYHSNSNNRIDTITQIIKLETQHIIEKTDTIWQKVIIESDMPLWNKLSLDQKMQIFQRSIEQSKIKGQFSYFNYINTYKNLAKTVQDEFKIPQNVILAIGLLESGAGLSKFSKESNNHFGLKCYNYDGEKVFFTENTINECYRKYNSVEDSYLDFALYLTKNEEYSYLFSFDIKDYRSWAKELQKNMNPQEKAYANKLIFLIESYQL